ncbi:MAG: T9SS type A sorting domain-containing protein [Bacteroidales bacterium]|nr:T9SS type A sorting domain-containing protein [Bacteroidales bacterium]
MKKTLFFLFILITSFSFAQLSGVYTVGSSNDDFQTIASAIDSVKQVGMSADVEFQISSGSYALLSITSFTPTNNFKLIVTSAAANTSSVIINHGYIENSQNIYIQNITFNKTTIDNDGALFIKYGNNVHIISCRITDTVNVYNGSQYASLRIIHMYNPYYSTVYVDSCYILSLGGIAPYVQYCYTIVQGGNGITYFRNDSIFGDINAWGSKQSFANSYISLPNEVKGTVFIDTCTLFFPQASYSYSKVIEAAYIKSSILTSSKKIRVKCKHIDNTVFNSGVSMAQIDGVIIQNSIFNKGLNTAFCDGFMIVKNQFYGEVSFNSEYGQFYNNFIFDTLRFTFGHVKIYNNSFGSNSLFLLAGTNAFVVNNCINLIDGSGIGTLSAFEKNNFVEMNDLATNFYSRFDSDPSFYDPQYISATDLHIQNPALFSRGKYYKYVKDDFDGELRDTIRSVGADESCLTLPLPDSIYMGCGNHYFLKMCFDSSNSYQWKPGLSLIDSTKKYPEIIVDTLHTVWLEDSLGTVLDSMVLVPTSNQLSYKRNLYASCGHPFQLNAYVPLGASIHWSPDSIFTNANVNPVHLTLDTSYLITSIVNTGKCGFLYDTINMIINTQPSPAFSWDSIKCLNVFFSPYEPCFDSVYWSFGDSTYSTDPYVWHEFPHKGFYKVRLNIWNDGYFSTSQREVYLNCVGIVEYEDSVSNDFIKIYPNPSTNFLNIELSESFLNSNYTIYNQIGKAIISGTIQSVNNRINITSLAKGFYILKIGNKATKFIRQ